jgi:hypothetical protein
VTCLVLLKDSYNFRESLASICDLIGPENEFLEGYSKSHGSAQNGIAVIYLGPHWRHTTKPTSTTATNIHRRFATVVVLFRGKLCNWTATHTISSTLGTI